MRHWALPLFLVAVFICAGSQRAWAQAPTLDDGPAPPPGAEAAAPAPEASSAPDEPTWDPLRAAKNMEVGAYYLKTGNLNAAIDRFQEAARAQPGLAKPYLLLGKAYEKKKDPKSAVSAYQKYLQLFPAAPDRGEVLKEIARQTSLIPKQSKQSALR